MLGKTEKALDGLGVEAQTLEGDELGDDLSPQSMDAFFAEIFDTGVFEFEPKRERDRIEEEKNDRRIFWITTALSCFLLLCFAVIFSLFIGYIATMYSNFILAKNFNMPFDASFVGDLAFLLCAPLVGVLLFSLFVFKKQLRGSASYRGCRNLILVLLSAIIATLVVGMILETFVLLERPLGMLMLGYLVVLVLFTELLILFWQSRSNRNTYLIAYVGILLTVDSLGLSVLLTLLN